MTATGTAAADPLAEALGAWSALRRWRRWAWALAALAAVLAAGQAVAARRGRAAAGRVFAVIEGDAPASPSDPALAGELARSTARAVLDAALRIGPDAPPLPAAWCAPAVATHLAARRRAAEDRLALRAGRQWVAWPGPGDVALEPDGRAATVGLRGERWVERAGAGSRPYPYGAEARLERFAGGWRVVGLAESAAAAGEVRP